MKHTPLSSLAPSWPRLVAALALAMAAGCGPRPEAPGGQDLPAAPQRIICGSPAVAEIVFALGCGDRVVGVSDYTVHPPEAAAKAGIGGWINPNRERLLALEPDLIITQGRHETLATFAEEYGIRFHTVNLDALPNIYQAIDSIAEAVDASDRGEALTTELVRRLQAIGERYADAPPQRVLLLLGRTPGSLAGLATVGPGTFLDDLIRTAGGVNVFADAAGAYPQVSKEALAIRKPEVILEVHPDGLSQAKRERLRADWQAFADLPAVADGRVHYLTNDYLLIPGPRLVQTAEAFAEVIHGAGSPPRGETR